MSPFYKLTDIPLEVAADYLVELRSFSKTASGVSGRALLRQVQKEKNSEGMDMLPPGGMGQHQPPPPLPPLAGAAAGDLPKLAAGNGVGDDEFVRDAKGRIQPLSLWDSTWARPSRERLKSRFLAEVRDPRLYSNLRGAAVLEDRQQRIAAHKGLKKGDGTVLGAMQAGFLRKAAAAKEDSELAEVGRQRAIANTASGLTSAELAKGTSTFGQLGRAVGGTGGALAGYQLAKHMGVSPNARLAATLASAYMGQSAGRDLGRSIGTSHDRRRFQEKFASALRKLAEDIDQDPLGSDDPMQGGVPDMGDSLPPEPSLAPQESPMTPEVLQYLQQEQLGMQQEEAGQAEFYKQRFEQASQQLQGAQQQIQQSQQQTAQLQQQLEQSNQTQQQTLDQARQIQDAAMQNAQAAQAAAAQSMQRTLATSNELIQQQQLSSQMRDTAQAMRASLTQVLQQPMPPATTLEAGVAPPAPPFPVQAQPPPQEQAQEQAPEQQQQMPQQEQAPPQAPQAQPPQGQEVTAAVKRANARLVGALVGGTLGVGGSLLESRRDYAPLRAAIQERQARDDAGGGFANAMQLAKAKIILTGGEFNQQHPVAAALAAGAFGASTGAAAGPQLQTIVKNLRG